MRRWQWILMLLIVGLCLMGGVYFERVISSGATPDAEAALLPGPSSQPAEVSPPAPGAEITKVGLTKVGAGTLTLVSGATPQAGTTGPGPLIEWGIGKTVGDLVPDISGHGYDAHLHGHASLETSWGGGPALEFDGQGSNSFWRDHSFDCGLSVEKPLGRAFNAMTVEAWVRKTTGGWMPIVYRDKWDEQSGFGMYMEWSAGKAVFGHYYDPSHKSQAQTDSAVQDGHWHHLVGTMQPAGDGYRYSIYVDGKLDAEQTGSWAVSASPPEGGVLLIGYPNASGADQPYQGGLGGLAIFDVALTPAQIKARFEAQRKN
jgi:hypothetical protein